MSDKFGCCHTCLFRGTSVCEDCEDADGYEFDEDLIDELEDRLAEAA